MKPFSWNEIFETNHARVLVVAHFIAFLTSRSLVDALVLYCVLFIRR